MCTSTGTLTHASQSLARCKAVGLIIDHCKHKYCWDTAVHNDASHCSRMEELTTCAFQPPPHQQVPQFLCQKNCFPSSFFRLLLGFSVKNHWSASSLLCIIIHKVPLTSYGWTWTCRGRDMRLSHVCTFPVGLGFSYCLQLCVLTFL